MGREIRRERKIAGILEVVLANDFVALFPPPPRFGDRHTVAGFGDDHAILADLGIAKGFQAEATAHFLEIETGGIIVGRGIEVARAAVPGKPHELAFVSADAVFVDHPEIDYRRHRPVAAERIPWPFALIPFPRHVVSGTQPGSAVAVPVLQPPVGDGREGLPGPEITAAVDADGIELRPGRQRPGGHDMRQMVMNRHRAFGFDRPAEGFRRLYVAQDTKVDVGLVELEMLEHVGERLLGPSFVTPVPRKAVFLLCEDEFSVVDQRDAAAVAQPDTENFQQSVLW